MNAAEMLRIVDSIHRDKNIDKEIVFQAIEAALVSAAKKHYGEEADIQITIGRADGVIHGTLAGEPLDSEETVGRIGAQTAKQVIIQKIREAERDALFAEYEEQIGQLINGMVQRIEGGVAAISLNNTEAILPRSEQIPGESHHPNERVRATIFEVKKQGPRIRIILSRIRPALVQRLFEQEIPEIADGVIEIRAMAREPGYRTKVAVSSNDQRVDCLGACVGQRGNRIKNIVDELSGERIDIVRWSDDMQVLIPNSLQPAEVEEVILCKMLGRAIVLVREDQLSLAIGRRGQNVRLASKLCGWDIEIMTRDELDETIDRAVTGFSAIEGVDDNLSGKLVEEGYLSYSDLSIIEPDDLMRMGNLTEEQVDAIVAEAEVREEQAEHAAAEARRKQREQDRIAAATAADPAPEEPAGDTAGEGAESSEPAADEAGVSAVANTEEASTEEASSEEVANNGEAASDDSTPDAAAVPKAEPAAGNDEPQP